MKKEKQEKIRLTSRGIIMDITSMRSYASNFLGKGKEYEPLLLLILKEDYYYNEDLITPTVKDLSAALGISYARVKKQLEQIYDDIIMDDEHSFELKETEYCFGLQNFAFSHRKKQYLTFTVKSLPVVPRVGERVNIPYFKEYMDTDYFFVEDVQHEFMDNKMRIYIQLKGGFYNKYWHIRLDEAKAKEELSLEDFWNLEDYQLMEKLRVRRPYKFD